MLPTSVPSRALVRLCKGGAKPCTPLARFMVGQLEPLVCKHPIRVRSVPVPTCRPLRKRPWNRTEICFLYVLVKDFSLGILFNPCLQTRSRHAGGAASIPSRPFALQLKTYCFVSAITSILEPAAVMAHRVLMGSSGCGFVPCALPRESLLQVLSTLRLGPVLTRRTLSSTRL